jgi:hypothetical protein
LELLVIVAVFLGGWWLLRSRKARREEAHLRWLDAIDKYAEGNSDFINQVDHYRTLVLNTPFLRSQPELVSARNGAADRIRNIMNSMPLPDPSLSPRSGLREVRDLYDKRQRLVNVAKEEAEKTVERLNSAVIEAIVHETTQHAEVLLRRRRQLIVRNDFGVPDTAKWERYLGEEFLSKQVGVAPPEALPFFYKAVDETIKAMHDTPGKSAEPAIKEMTPVEYERHCAAILEDAGWTCALTAASGDQGVDILAEKDGLRVALQCKL